MYYIMVLNLPSVLRNYEHLYLLSGGICRESSLLDSWLFSSEDLHTLADYLHVDVVVLIQFFLHVISLCHLVHYSSQLNNTVKDYYGYNIDNFGTNSVYWFPNKHHDFHLIERYCNNQLNNAPMLRIMIYVHLEHPIWSMRRS